MYFLIYNNNKMVGYSTAPVICENDQVIEVDEKTYKNAVENFNNINIELLTIKSWFNEYYPQHEQKYRRLHLLNKLTDEGKNPYEELVKLYEEAEIKRARIQELEVLTNA